jgi:hypothetical protein
MQMNERFNHFWLQIYQKLHIWQSLFMVVFSDFLSRPLDQTPPSVHVEGNYCDAVGRQNASAGRESGLF